MNDKNPNNSINNDIYDSSNNEPEQGYMVNYNLSQGYPTPKHNETQPKKKKRHIFLRLFGFTAAALFFGVVAGAAASGYNYLFGNQKNEIVVLDGEKGRADDRTVIELSEDNSTLTTDTKIEGVITDVSDVVEKVMPSIVSISSTDLVTQYDIFFGRQFSQPVEGSGSGIIIGQSDSSILILTNNHVVANAEDIKVEFIDENKVSAVVKGADSNSDLAILEVDIENMSEDTLKAIRVASLGDSENLKAGEMVIAIGNALGYGQSVTVGYVSALNREVSNQNITMNLIQTDAAINPGNSGGALININGEVIGINSLKYADTKVEGMGYAIPISDAIPMINLLINNKALSASDMGFLGINVQTAQNVTRDLSLQFNMPIGVFVKDIVEDSPAQLAGLKPGNIIVGINDVKIETVDDILNILTYSRPGERIIVKVRELQNAEYIEKDIEVILGDRP